jgi:aminoglycoside/choline kinase family phosphotransferase
MFLPARAGMLERARFDMDHWARRIDMSIPATTRSITADWLTDTMHRSGQLDTAAQVATVVHEPIAGVGLLSEVARLRMTYRGGAADGPATVIAKGAVEAPENRRMAMSVGCYEREVRFYQDVAPRLGVRVPGCLAADLDNETGEFVLLLEDLTDVGAGDQLTGATLEQARVAVDQMALFHATWWNSPELDRGGRLGWIPTLDSELNLAGCPVIRGCWEPFVARYADRIGADGVALGAWVQEHCEEIYYRAAGGPLTVVHNDFRMDNLLFDALDPSRPGGFAVIDWQLVVAGSGVSDLQYFLTASLPIATRRATECQLLNRYAARLAEHGIDLNRDDLWDRYRLSTLFYLPYAIVMGGGMEVGGDRGRALADRTVDCFFAAALDHGRALAY